MYFLVFDFVIILPWRVPEVFDWFLPSFQLYLHACLGRCICKWETEVCLADFPDPVLSTWGCRWIYSHSSNGKVRVLVLLILDSRSPDPTLCFFILCHPKEISRYRRNNQSQDKMFPLRPTKAVQEVKSPKSIHTIICIRSKSICTS